MTFCEIINKAYKEKLVCGISGIFRYNGIADDDVGFVKKMNSIQRHRGPDDEGLYVGQSCILGHRRLSIIDLSKAGHQPFASDDGRYQLVFNGEIYNYIELRNELRQLGWRFSTQTDTEVLIKTYQQYGKKCLSKFNGMFSFAIYDSKKRTLFLARDRVGIKPLYYMTVNSTFYFASEIKTLLSASFLHPSLNYQSLFDYLVFNRTDVFDETFVNEIKRLPKGHYAVVDQEGRKHYPWWDPEAFVDRTVADSLPEIRQKIKEIAISSLKLRMRSDVRVGSCLSGGLDSSILIGILFSEIQVEKGYPTFTAAFPGNALDETGFVDKLNRKYPFKSFRAYPKGREAFEDLKAFVYSNDEPTTNATFYSQYAVMKLARETGVTVLLDGQGGDENFAGYQYFHGFYWYGLLKQRALFEFSSEFSKSLLRKQDKSAYQTLLFQLLPDMVRKKLLFKAAPYLRRDFFYQYIDSSLIYKEFFSAEGLNHSLARHFQYKLEHLLRMEDRNSMAYSIEARVPYLDYRLIEYVLGISERIKIRGGVTKYLQTQALGNYTIPDILSRKDKIGFGTPGDEWMRDENWRNLITGSCLGLSNDLSDVFRTNIQYPDKGNDAWKISQLYIWKTLFGI